MEAPDRNIRCLWEMCGLPCLPLKIQQRSLSPNIKPISHKHLPKCQYLQSIKSISVAPSVSSLQFRGFLKRQVGRFPLVQTWAGATEGHFLMQTRDISGPIYPPSHCSSDALWPQFPQQWLSNSHIKPSRKEQVQIILSLLFDLVHPKCFHFLKKYKNYS